MKLLANVLVPETDPGFATWFTGYLRSATSAEIAAQLMSTGATTALRVRGALAAMPFIVSLPCG